MRPVIFVCDRVTSSPTSQWLFMYPITSAPQVGRRQNFYYLFMDLKNKTNAQINKGSFFLLKINKGKVEMGLEPQYLTTSTEVPLCTTLCVQ